jgi:hypothetical protein
LIRWEYHIEVFDWFDGEIVFPSKEALNKLGQDGWELTAVSTDRAYFKRSIIEAYTVTREEIEAWIPPGYYD